MKPIEEVIIYSVLQRKRRVNMKRSKLYEEIKKNNEEIMKANKEKIKEQYEKMRKESECHAETPTA